MLRLSALTLLAAMAFTNFAQVHPQQGRVQPAVLEIAPEAMLRQTGPETLAVYYSPLPATEVSRYVGLGLAYHMAVVYTDAAGRSFGVSSGPSNLSTPQTPGRAFSAILDMASEAPSAFGTLIADPHNNTPFRKGSTSDYYTQDSNGHAYPHRLVMRGENLSAQWTSIVRTYASIGRLSLTYSPVTQNSNSMAATALRRAGLEVNFSSQDLFTPGAFTTLPMGRDDATLAKPLPVPAAAHTSSELQS